MNWKVRGNNCSFGYSYYISNGKSSYLWKDGTTHTGTLGIDDPYKHGYWKTKQEAEEFLRNWKGSNMIDDKIQQCEADIQKLTETLERLKKEKNFRCGIPGEELLGDWIAMKKWLKENRPHGNSNPTIIKHHSNVLLSFRMPVCNAEWTLSVYRYLDKMVQEFGEGWSGHHVCPVHGDYCPDNQDRYVYVRLGV